MVAKLNTEVRVLLADPATVRLFDELGQNVPTLEEQTPEGLAALQAAEIEKWWPIIKAAGVKSE